MFRVILCSCLLALSVDGFVIVTTSGPVRGKLVTDQNITYYAYQGIPYAENPTGPLRFKPPVPKKPWIKVLNASEPGPACPQPEGRIKRHQMSEDCLSINVFVPADRPQQLLPVYVNVHGGAFKSNSNNASMMNGPQFFLKRGIIYVNMNYRLGALGYLSLETEEASGNAGLKDSLLALKWVKKNIRKFGGSEVVTIGGQSSGAAMVHYMLLTDKSAGLFQRAIMNSGSATNFRFLSRYPKDHALALANQLGFDTANVTAILRNLRNANAFDILDAQENLYKNKRNVFRAFAPFVPTVEKKFVNSIITRNPTEIIKDGIPQNVPILAGVNSEEGAFQWPSLHTKSTKTLQELFPECIPADIEYPTESDMYKDLVISVAQFYFGDTNLTNWTLTNFYGLISDTQYAQSVGNWLKVHKQRQNSEKLYYYLFNFDGDLNWSKITYNISYPGAVHSDEMGYLFVNQATQAKLNNLDSRSQKTLNKTVTVFTNFVKYGNPNHDQHGIEWPEYGEGGSHLLINDHPTSESKAPFTQRFAFWKNVYEQYKEYVKNGGKLKKIPSEAV